MTRRHYNSTSAVVQLVNSISNSSTSLVVSDASSLPTTYPWSAVLDAGLATQECVLVTAGSGATLTVTRAYDGSAAQAHAANASFAHAATAADYDEANAHVNATSAVHGVVGALVGTSDTQTLSNKTLTTPTITGGTATNQTLTTPTINNPTISNPTLTGFPAPGIITPYAGLTVPTGWFLCDGSTKSRTTQANLWNALHATFSGASWVADGFGGYTVTVSSTTGLGVGMTCYQAGVTAAGVITSIQSSTVVGVFPGSGFTTGTHDLVVAPYGGGDGSTTFNLPNLVGSFLMGAGTDGTAGHEGLGASGGSKGHNHNLSSNGQALVNTGASGGSVQFHRVATASYDANAANTTSGTASQNTGMGFGVALAGTTDLNGDTRPPFTAVQYIIKN